MLLVMSGRKQCATIDIANYTFSKKRDGMTNTTNQKSCRQSRFKDVMRKMLTRYIKNHIT